MATGGVVHHKRDSTGPGHQWKGLKDFLRLKVPDKSKKRGALLASSASAHDLRVFEMEEEKQDITSPRGVIEACLESGSTSPEDSPLGSQVHCSTSRVLSNWSNFFTSWKKKSLKRLSSFTPLPVSNMSKWKSSSTKESKVLRNLYGFKSSMMSFTLAELQGATKNFNLDNLIGRGGYAVVYRGCLPDGRLVAIKKLSKGTTEEMATGFLSELGVLAHLNHPNIAKLLGCGIEGGMHLVFKFSPLGSLVSVLHGPELTLDWSKRYRIALGTADDLLYLHETSRRRIIHRDIKADNILLTEDFEPQALFVEHNAAGNPCRSVILDLLNGYQRIGLHHKFEGTFGYFSPEYFMHGIVDEKTDIFAFGVLLLELITGRRALDNLQQSLVIWAKPFLNSHHFEELVDPSLGGNYNREEMDHVVLTASICVEQSPILRPRMSQVAILLRGDKYVLECVKQCQRRSLQRTYSEEIFDAHEYNATKHLRDLNRLKEIALA